MNACTGFTESLLVGYDKHMIRESNGTPYHASTGIIEALGQCKILSNVHA